MGSSKITLPSEEKLVEIICEKPVDVRYSNHFGYIMDYSAKDILDRLRPHLTKDNGWIDVNDRLPVATYEEDGECPVIIEDSYQGERYTKMMYKCCVKIETDIENAHQRITHWLDIPDLPKPPTSKGKSKK